MSDVSRTMLLVRELGAYVLALPGIGWPGRDKDDVAVALLAAVEAAAREDCRAAQEPLAEALRLAQEHLRELREAWVRGIIREGDTLGGTRSNRNVDVLLAISKALAAYGGQAVL